MFLSRLLRTASLPALAAATAAAAALVLPSTGCSTSSGSRANYLWSHGFGWTATDNPVVHASPLLRSGDVVLGATRNGRGRAHLVEANLADGTLVVDRLDRDADPAQALQARAATHAGLTFSQVPPRSPELVSILEKLNLDKVHVAGPPIKESTGSRLGQGVDTRTTSRIDPNTLPSGQGQTLNTN